MASFKPNLRRAWRRTFWHVYDNIALLILANCLWLGLSVTIILIPAATIAIFHIAHEITHNRPAKIKNFFTAMRKYFLKITLIALILCVFWFSVSFNIKFYLQHWTVLAGVTFWLYIFSLLGLIYICPLLCRGFGTVKSIKYSYVFVIDNLRISLLLTFYLLLLICLEILLPILGLGVLAVFASNAFLEIEKRYNPELEINEPKRTLTELLRPWEFS